MASTHGGSQSEFDDRLAKALDSTLLAGEEVVAKEVGDQGQAIVLTDSRILVLKAGLAATGELNGQAASAFALSDVVAVNLRRGPLGAVIQISAQVQASVDGTRPDNVVIFTGPGRVKKADAFAATVESMAGKTVNRIEPQARSEAAPEQSAKVEPASQEHVAQVEPAVSEPPTQAEQVITPSEVVEAVEEHPAPERPKGGRVYKPLAEMMYGEMTQASPATPVYEAPVPPVREAAESPVQEALEAPVAEPLVPHQPLRAEPASALDFDLSFVQPQEESTTECETEDEPEQVQSSPYSPNPRLPKPMRYRHYQGPNKVLVAFGVLAALMLVGMAVIAPLHDTSTVTVAPSADSTNDVRKVQLQLTAVTNYRSDVAKLLAKADAEATSFKSAARSRNKSSMVSCSKLGATDRAWQDLSDLQAPPGLAEAKQNMLDGLAARKNAISIAAASASAGSSADVEETLRRLAGSESQIKSGLSAIDLVKIGLQRQIAKAAPAAKGTTK